MTGTTLKSLEYVPTAVLRHLGRQFARPVPDVATLRTLYRRRKTRFEYQRWAVEQWGLREFDAGIEQRLTEYIRERTHATLSRGRLEQAAREWLYRTYVAIPRRRVITDLGRGVIQSVAQQDHRDLRRFMTEYSIQGFLRDLLFHRPGGTMTYLEWLRRPPRRRSLKTLRELYDKYQWLEERIGRGLPIPIPKERQQVYSRRLWRRRASASRPSVRLRWTPTATRILGLAKRSFSGLICTLAGTTCADMAACTERLAGSSWPGAGIEARYRPRIHSIRTR